MKYNDVEKYSKLIKEKEMKEDGKELMFVVTKSLSKQEAESFARSLSIPDELYLAKVWENPNERRRAKRERFVVCRPLRKDEIVDNAYGEYFKKQELMKINRCSLGLIKF